MLRNGENAKKTNKLASLARVVSAFVFIVFSTIYYSDNTFAANMVTRSATVGSSLPSETTYHEFRFTTLTSGSVGSIVFEYCNNLPFYGAPCTVPTGLNVDGASLTIQSGLTGFSVSASDTNANKIVITRTAAVSAPTAASYHFENIVNQSTVNESVFVRISTHTSTNGSGVQIDDGAVVYATAEGVGVGGFVPPHLTFCVGVTVADNCSSTTGSLLTLGELSELTTRTSSSQFAAATNDPTGYNVYISGGTMTSGNEIIPALADNSSSQTGISQFGINLRSNTNPAVGANASGTGTGSAVSNYNVSNSFRYNDGELIAKSVLPTNYNKFTVSYIVNVSSEQPAGVYASSFTYTAIASF